MYRRTISRTAPAATRKYRWRAIPAEGLDSAARKIGVGICTGPVVYGRAAGTPGGAWLRYRGGRGRRQPRQRRVRRAAGRLVPLSRGVGEAGWLRHALRSRRPRIIIIMCYYYCYCIIIIIIIVCVYYYYYYYYYCDH